MKLALVPVWSRNNYQIGSIQFVLTLRLPLVVKARPQILHLKGLSPVWVR